MSHDSASHDLACFVISVAARLLEVHPQTLRYYERAGLIQPSRSKGNIRLYSPNDLEQARQIKRLMNDLGVNLAGVEVILRLSERIRSLERELEIHHQTCQPDQGAAVGQRRSRTRPEGTQY